MAPTRRSALLIAYNAVQTALVALETALDDEPNPCTHPNKVETTTMGSKTRKWACPSCHTEWEGDA